MSGLDRVGSPPYAGGDGIPPGEGCEVLELLAALLPRHAYRFDDEVGLHAAISELLDRTGVAYEHEVVAGPRDRFDFLCKGQVVIEAKIRGSLHVALRQCARYAARPDVSGVLLATTRFWGREMGTGVVLHRTPVRVVRLGGQAF